MLYILLGEDDFSRRQSLEEIKAGAGDPSLLAANTTTFDGQQVTLDELRTACETVPFLTEKRLVIVNGLLRRFEPKSSPGRQKKTTRAANNQQNEYKPFSTYIAKTPDSTTLVLIDGRISANSPLLKELSSQAEVRSFPPLREAKLRQWIQQQVREEGGSISPTAVNLLAKLVGSNLWIMTGEINKLVLFTSGHRIGEEEVRMIVSHAEETSVFTMVDAILELKAGVAEELLQRLLEKGAAPAYILVMLLRQVEMIVRVKELRNQKRSSTEIQNRLGLTSEFVLRKTTELADRYPWRRLKEMYHKLLEADLSIKTGKYDGELALNILIADLCQRISYR